MKLTTELQASQPPRVRSWRGPRKVFEAQLVSRAVEDQPTDCRERGNHPEDEAKDPYGHDKLQCSKIPLEARCCCVLFRSLPLSFWM